MPLLVECLTEPGEVLDFNSTKPETAASASLRLAISHRSAQTLMRALDDCDAVILPTRDELEESNDRVVDALHAGRFVIAQRSPSYEPLQEFLWMGRSVAEGIAWLRGHPREALQRLQRGQRYVSRHHNKAALLRFWFELLDLASTLDASALIERGRQQYALGKLSEAQQLLVKALQIDKAAPDLHRLLGHVYRDAGKLDHAITSYRRAIRLDPDFAAAYDDLGIAYASKGWPEDAIQCHWQALKIDPDNRTTHLNLASALRSIGQHSEARKHRHLAMRLHVRNHARQLLSRCSGTQ